MKYSDFMDLINDRKPTGFDLKTEKYLIKKYIKNYNAIHEWMYKCLLDVELKIKNDLGVALKIDVWVLNNKKYWIKQCDYSPGLLELYLSKNWVGSDYDILNVEGYINNIINHSCKKEEEFLALELNYS